MGNVPLDLDDRATIRWFRQGLASGQALLAAEVAGASPRLLEDARILLNSILDAPEPLLERGALLEAFVATLPGAVVEEQAARARSIARELPRKAPV